MGVCSAIQPAGPARGPGSPAGRRQQTITRRLSQRPTNHCTEGFAEGDKTFRGRFAQGNKPFYGELEERPHRHGGCAAGCVPLRVCAERPGHLTESLSSELWSSRRVTTILRRVTSHFTESLRPFYGEFGAILRRVWGHSTESLRSELSSSRIREPETAAARPG